MIKIIKKGLNKRLKDCNIDIKKLFLFFIVSIFLIGVSYAEEIGGSSDSGFTAPPEEPQDVINDSVTEENLIEDCDSNLEDCEASVDLNNEKPHTEEIVKNNLNSQSNENLNLEILELEKRVEDIETNLIKDDSLSYMLIFVILLFILTIINSSLLVTLFHKKE